MDIREDKFVQIGCPYDYYRYRFEKISLLFEERFLYTGDVFANFNSPIQKIIYVFGNKLGMNKIHFWRKKWAKFVIEKGTRKRIEKMQSDKLCFIFYIDSYKQCAIFDEVEFIRKHFIGCKVVIVLNDKCDLYERVVKRFDIERIKQEFDLVISYNIEDVGKYGLVQDRFMCIPYDEYKSASLVYDVFFVGKEKGRLQEILNVYEICRKSNLNCLFYISDVIPEKQVKRDGIVYNEKLPYLKVLELVSQSKCVLNVLQEGSIGITLRDYECIGMNKVLITNNRYLKETDFYTEEKVIFTDELENDIGKVINFDSAKEWRGKTEYTIQSYFEWLSNKLSDL